jgi:hypothetical protein
MTTIDYTLKLAMNRAALARMPACSGARRADHAEPMVLDFPRTRAYPCYYNCMIVVLILIKRGDVWTTPLILKRGDDTRRRCCK